MMLVSLRWKQGGVYFGRINPPVPTRGKGGQNDTKIIVFSVFFMKLSRRTWAGFMHVSFLQVFSTRQKTSETSELERNMFFATEM